MERFQEKWEDIGDVEIQKDMVRYRVVYADTGDMNRKRKIFTSRFAIQKCRETLNLSIPHCI